MHDTLIRINNFSWVQSWALVDEFGGTHIFPEFLTFFVKDEANSSSSMIHNMKWLLLNDLL